MSEQDFIIPQKKKRRIWPIILVLILIGVFSLFFFKASFTISRVVEWDSLASILPSSDNFPALPEKDPSRINILLLGFRGEDDPGEGKYLSDAITLISIDKNSNKVALISFPRDLYARLWCDPGKKKINFAYAQGGLECAKKTISYISGQYIDFAVSVDFEGLKELVDSLGGVEIYLEKPFQESFQWAKEGWEEDEYWNIQEIEGEENWVFQVPAGQNHLDGKTTLYYVRSRYSTNDFDRIRRQQQVLLAIKEKALSLGFLANPVKIYQMMDILSKHVRTDIELKNAKSLIDLANNLDKKEIKTRYFDNGPNGLLYDTFINKEYILLPQGDNFEKIQEVCKNIFD